MKVGDLVKYKNLHGHVVGGKFISKSWVGVILEIAEESKWTKWMPGIKLKPVRVLWSGGPTVESADSLVVVNKGKLGVDE